MPPESPLQSLCWEPLRRAPPSPAQASLTMDHIDEPSESSFTTKQKDDKLPHDASVFVGSLPSNIDQGDLTRMLMEHLSEHTQIKNIKVVRDSKGGVCAFVQCKDANSATALMQTLHSRPPKPFLGRILRYEPARAFRTLLISYRAPTQLVRPAGFNPSDPTTFKSDELELELPTSMKVWKHRNSRFHNISYNSEAAEPEENQDQSGISDPSLENALHISPVKCDAETLHELAAYFGPLETFSVFDAKPDSDDGEAATVDYTLYPVPHNAHRSPTMETTCWEIKWEHRDDCVSALMTLRRVPHLTVTWAHQPSSQSALYHTGLHHMPGSPTYSLHVQHRGHRSPSGISPGMGHTPRFRPSFQAFPKFEDDELPGQHYSPVSPSFGRDALQRSPLQSWSQEVDTLAPPDFDRSGEVGKPPTSPLARRPWNRRAITLANPPGSRNSFREIVQDGFDRETSVDMKDSSEADCQELFIPQTPSLDTSSITPVTPGSQFPITPSTSGYDTVAHDTPYHEFDEKVQASAFKAPRAEKEIDPTTLFVGGLEMFGPGAWDEEKVRKFFSRFGGLESVKVVRPLNACAAFAFVKFDNAESPARAVYEEHNRVYEGRAMRVQLRDCNPPRNNWKFGRGRGRFHQNNFNNQRRFYYRPSLEGQRMDSFQSQIAPSTTSIGDRGEIPEIQLSSLESALPSPVGTPRDETPPALPATGQSNLAVNSSGDEAPQTERYREWYDELESPAHTPAPSSLGSSVSTTNIPYPAPPYPYMPNAPYFHPPPPWVHPYMPPPPPHYQVPYYSGYPAYPPGMPPRPPQSFGSPPGSDTSAPPATPQPAWPMGMYGAFIPYPGIPQATSQGHLHPPATQAPLLPTGFIQNEQGTLIAVYQPEALDQYMAGSGGHPAPAVIPQDTGAQRWAAPTPPRPYDMGNIQHPAAHPQPNQGMQRHVGTPSMPSQRFLDGSQRPPVPFRGGESIVNTPTPPLYRRQGTRREHTHNYNSSRNHHQPPANNPRMVHGKPVRAHMQNLQTPDHGQGMLQPGQTYAGWT